MRSKRIWILILLGLLGALALWRASTQNAQSAGNTVIASLGAPGGWLADGSQLLLSPYVGSPRVWRVHSESGPIQWDYSQAQDLCARLSPDGQKVVYIGETRTEKHWSEVQDAPIKELYLISQAWPTPTLVITSTSSIGCPSWSSDSKQFAAGVRMGRIKPTLVFDAETLRSRLLYTGTLSMGQLALSPDGKLLAFSENKRIKIIRVATGEALQIPPLEGQQPTWSPNSQYLAYIQPKYTVAGGAGNLMIVKIDGSDQQMLIGVKGEPQSGDHLYDWPLWSPRGDYIAAARLPIGIDDPIRTIEKSDIVLIAVSEALKQVTTQ